MTIAPAIRLVNESALGIYAFSWTSPRTRARNVVSWFDGLDVPMFEFYSATRGGMTPPVPVRNPARFGTPWPPRKKVADFKAFAAAFAQACETTEDQP